MKEIETKWMNKEAPGGLYIFIWKWMNLDENERNIKWMRIYENLWKWMKIKENQRKWKKFDEMYENKRK